MESNLLCIQIPLFQKFQLSEHPLVPVYSDDLYMYTYLQAINDCKVIDSFCNTLVIRPILLLLELNQLPIHIENG